MNEKQLAALEFARDGHSIFICGQAGTGKSFVLRCIVEELRRLGKRCALTCSTGVACTHFASQFGANTVHRWESFILLYLHIGDIRVISICLQMLTTIDLVHVGRLIQMYALLDIHPLNFGKKYLVGNDKLSPTTLLYITIILVDSRRYYCIRATGGLV